MEIIIQNQVVRLDKDDYSKFCILTNFKTLSIGNHGYVRFFDKGKYRLFHRWLFDYPELTIDHINGNQLDNRKRNLRLVTLAENFRNLNDPLYTNNTSGIRGVNYHYEDDNWCARVQVNGKRVLLGYFKRKNEAIAARKQAEIDYGFLQPIGEQV